MSRLERKIRIKIAKLEKRTYGHTDNTEDITEQIMYIVKASSVQNEQVKETIANEAINLLENHRFE